MAITKVSRGLLNTGVSDSSDATAITINSSEQVGIGTTSPNTLLHASTGSNSSGLIDVARFQNVGTTVNDGARIQLTSGTSTSGAGIGCLGVALNSAHLVFHSGGNNERMRIDSSGNVGIGTTSPTQKLDVNGYIKATRIGAGISPIVPCEVLSTGATSTALRVLKSGSDDSTQNNLFSVTEISGHGRLSIHDTSQNEDIRLDSNGDSYFNGGDVGINLTNPDSILQIGNNDGSSYRFGYGGTSDIYFDSDAVRFRTDNGGANIAMISSSGVTIGTSVINGKINVYYSSVFGEILRYTGSTTTVYPLVFEYGGATAGSISITSSATSYNTSSDYRLKENVNYEFDALSRVAKLKPARFNFISDADKTVDGFIAHEVSDIVPEAITGEKDGEQMQGIDQSKLVPLLTKAIQEQQEIIDDLKARIEVLEA